MAAGQQGDYQSCLRLYGGRKLEKSANSGRKELLPSWLGETQLWSNRLKILRIIPNLLNSSLYSWASRRMICWLGARREEKPIGLLEQFGNPRNWPNENHTFCMAILIRFCSTMWKDQGNSYKARKYVKLTVMWAIWRWLAPPECNQRPFWCMESDWRC